MNRVIKVGRELVPVSEEVYREYYRLARRQRYMERDIKVGRIQVDPAGETAVFVPSKEDSIDRLLEQGVDFAGRQTTEDIVCHKTTRLALQRALAALEPGERELIRALYYENRTVREVARENNVSHVAVVKRHQRVLDKLRKFFI
ncbi:sigma-70 family RNA polymerase sigma factor [Desulfallas thermosapovorans]|uniref:RNA polymerase sigma factor (Sigma-70 family) n=1 Tax=Desulfallas thermosapovorans DSM 6562 TaxID=1121431 RepID=A0A5S4ZN09_9FIRM|nr:sigma-70 family RNA polymerase sigma factor [Desulfallas thermosapovorans]TYO92294.1 RNA polymerase sigma factor (sigma-70 family) [Desulfallas thermosapovorans DSM 6562]